MNKKFIVRFVDDPTGLATPVISLWLPERWVTSGTLYATEEEAYEDACRDPKFGSPCHMVILIIPVYVAWDDDGHSITTVTGESK